MSDLAELQRLVEKLKRFECERDDARRRLAEAAKALEHIGRTYVGRVSGVTKCLTCGNPVEACNVEFCSGGIARRALASTPPIPLVEPACDAIGYRVVDNPDGSISVVDPDPGASRPTALDAATVEACAAQAANIGRGEGKSFEMHAAGLEIARQLRAMVVTKEGSPGIQPGAEAEQNPRRESVRLEPAPPPGAALRSPPPAGPTATKESWRECTCLGTCKGPEGLAPGWRCALGRVVVRADQVTPGEPPAGPVCAWFCGREEADHDERDGESHLGAGTGFCFCTEACLAAGRSLNPGDSRP